MGSLKQRAQLIAYHDGDNSVNNESDNSPQNLHPVKWCLTSKFEILDDSVDNDFIQPYMIVIEFSKSLSSADKSKVTNLLSIHTKKCVSLINSNDNVDSNGFKINLHTFEYLDRVGDEEITKIKSIDKDVTINIYKLHAQVIGVTKLIN